MRLIDADALIDFIDCGHLRNSFELCFSERDVVDMLESRPTIDAVPVVRCEECSNKEEHSYYCLLHSIFVRSDFFCKDGVK